MVERIDRVRRVPGAGRVEIRNEPLASKTLPTNEKPTEPPFDETLESATRQSQAALKEADRRERLRKFLRYREVKRVLGAIEAKDKKERESE